MANILVQSKEQFNYVFSCDLAVPLQIKIGSLEGDRGERDVKAIIEDPMLQFSGKFQVQQERSDLYVECRIFEDGKPICLPCRTAHKTFSNRWSWNEWLQLPILVKDIPRTAKLAITVYDILGPGKAEPVGGTTVSLFGKRSCLHKGNHDLKLWRNKIADASADNTTPGKLSNDDSEMARLRKLVKKYRSGLLPDVDWMDRMVFREIEHVNEKEKKETNYMYLMIEFPHFHLNFVEYRVVYYQRDVVPSVPMVTENPEMKLIFDPEWNMDNLVEGKHHKLTFTPNRKGTKRNIEPSPKHKLMLQQIINYPPLHPLSNREKHLVWMYRYYLSQDGRALPKFLKSVRWSIGKEFQHEVEEALELLHQWHPMEAGEALELLNAEFTADRTHPAIRQYAVSQLQNVDNEELQFYLLQLIQAIRYDPPSGVKELTEDDEEGHLQLFVDDTHYNAAESRIIEQQLADAMDEGSLAKQQLFTQSEQLSMEKDLDSDDEEENPNQFEEDIDMSSSAGSSTVGRKQYTTLAAFLVDRACSSTRLSNYFYWYLSIECEENKERYIRVRRKFLENLFGSANPKWRARYYMLKEQQNFTSKILELRARVMSSGGDREKKIDVLRKLVSSDEWQHFTVPVRLPLDPTQVIVGLDPEWVTVYKSKLNPMGLTFKTITGKKYRVILKHGDDLRQDELILQLLALMDRLLKKEKLDLKLSPYKVLACSSSPYGFVEHVDATVGVADVLSKYKSIQNFFVKMSSPGSTGGEVNPEVMDNYVRSCAGYCVITYLLIVGDRHFDNLLLTPNGKLLHIDFSYILGRDPKPFAPPMKLSKEMVEAMGGTGSPDYQSFRKYCYITFQALRRSAHLLLNLFALMIHSSIPDIALEQEKSVQKVKDKFHLELSEEEAIQVLQNLIDDSVNDILASMLERAHKIAQYFRK